jgi:LysR family transcriptional regulator, nitrogen assimilation regulatory protein
MNLADLRLFVRAAELGSFSKAAAAAGVAQPTVTRIIRQLEAAWDGHLFYRTGRGVMLSELGQEALMRVRALLREADQVSEDLRAFSRLPSGVVSIGMPTSLVATAVPILINQLHAALPGIHLQVHEGFNDEIERWLAEGAIDIGARSKYREGMAPEGTLIASPLVVAGPRAGWSLPPEIDFRALEAYALVLPARSNAVRIIVDAVARRMKLRLNIIADVDSTLGQEAIARQCGCYMVKAPPVASRDDAGPFVSSVIRNPAITRSIDLATSHQRPLSRASRQVFDRLAVILKALGTGQAPPSMTGQSEAAA